MFAAARTARVIAHCIQVWIAMPAMNPAHVMTVRAIAGRSISQTNAFGAMAAAQADGCKRRRSAAAAKCAATRRIPPPTRMRVFQLVGRQGGLRARFHVRRAGQRGGLGAKI
jgi:hypothetical protein